ncbi:metallophosphoesterase [Bacillus cereus]|uniref:metallophosphoesterase n=1 Tax=Bacillus cereus TaxID=1396 RepID=UPI000BF975D0|nr:metallophosphoesterase [Bacillus cereus]PFA64056.1 hypothetical protein CN403_29845 [Bacillus cereus]
MVNYIGKKSSVLQALVITSDPQYPWTTEMDIGNDNRTEDEKKRISEDLIKEQYNSINAYTQNINRSIILINGDLTAFGHGWQTGKMENLLGLLKKPYYLGLGNHDIENNLNDCYLNNCFRNSMKLLHRNIKKHNLPSSDVDINRISPYGGYKGSFAYAHYFGNLCSIQLNNFPTMNADSGEAQNAKPRYKIEENLNWLEAVLKKAKTLGKIIIVNVHKPDCWTIKPGCKDAKPNQRFKNLLKEYNVLAVFAGHYHQSLGYRGSYENYFGDVPVFLSGSASQRSYLILEQTKNELLVYSVKNNNWKEKKLEKSIKYTVKLVGDYEIVSALNNNLALDVNIDDNNNVMLWSRNQTSRQTWGFKYDYKQEAYQIKSIHHPGEISSLLHSAVLAWNDYNQAKDVFVTCNYHKPEHYWYLEYVGDEYYIIKNKKNPNLVLNVKGGQAHNGNDITVDVRNGKKAQMFKLNKIFGLPPLGSLPNVLEKETVE